MEKNAERRRGGGCEAEHGNPGQRPDLEGLTAREFDRRPSPSLSIEEQQTRTMLNPTTAAFTSSASALADGVYNFDLGTLHAAGNENTTTLPTIDVATKAPKVTASESISGFTNKNVDTITETATAEAVGTNAIKLPRSLLGMFKLIQT